MNNLTLKLLQNIKDKASAALILSEENRLYYTGFASTDGALLVTENEAVFYTDSRYTEAAGKKIGTQYVRDTSHLYDDINAYLSDKSSKSIAIENDRITVAECETLKAKLPGIEIVTSSLLSNLITKQRLIKSREEINNIVLAQRIAERAFNHILGFIKPGVTEKDIALELNYYMLKNGADGLSFETIAVSGVNSSMPHGVPSNKKIEKGDFITMDYGAVVNGYHSDMTRTVIIGSPTQKQLTVYNTVLEAQKKSIAALKSGISGKEADLAARAVITEAGFGSCFGHGTGHGVGVEIHEAPSLSPKSKSVLKAGNIVTVEPGIYIPGEFGVRIEDMALITDSGCEILTNCEKELIIL